MPWSTVLQLYSATQSKCRRSVNLFQIISQATSVPGCVMRRWVRSRKASSQAPLMGPSVAPDRSRAASRSMNSADSFSDRPAGITHHSSVTGVWCACSQSVDDMMMRVTIGVDGMFEAQVLQGGAVPPEGGGESSQERTMASISISTAGSVSRDGCPVIMHTIARRK